MLAELDKLTPFHCRGCGRIMGYSTTDQPETRVYCEAICAVQGPLSGNEERDSLIVELGTTEHWTAKKLADTFDITRQRVQQVLQRSRSGG